MPQWLKPEPAKPGITRTTPHHFHVLPPHFQAKFSLISYDNCLYYHPLLSCGLWPHSYLNPTLMTSFLCDTQLCSFFTCNTWFWLIFDLYVWLSSIKCATKWTVNVILLFSKPPAFSHSLVLTFFILHHCLSLELDSSHLMWLWPVTKIIGTTTY